MGRSFQRTNIFPRLTVFQNIQAAFVSHRGRGFNLLTPVERLYREETEALLAAVGLSGQAGEVSGFLSHGGQKQLELGIALALEPEILLLDEPTAGMSAAETRDAIALIERLARDRNLTLLFTEHDMEVVFSIAQRITVLHQGRVIADGTPADVRARRGSPPGLPGREAPMRAPILVVDEIHTAYGLSQVLFGVSLEVAQGACVCLLGRNGVGKTTTMRSIMGLTPPRRGRVVWKGQDITGPTRPPGREPWHWLRSRGSPHLRRADGVGEPRRRPPGGAGQGAGPSERVYELFPKLRELRDRQGGFLSGGEQQMLTIARTLMGNPELLLLDEPSEGLAPLVVDHLKEQIDRLKRDGLTILLAEQNVDFCLDLADRVYVLEKGHIRYHGSAQEFREDESIRHQYLAL